MTSHDEPKWHDQGDHRYILDDGTDLWRVQRDWIGTWLIYLNGEQVSSERCRSEAFAFVQENLRNSGEETIPL